MKALDAKIRQLAQWIDRRSLRERAMILAAVLAIGIACGTVLYFTPQENKREGIESQIAELNVSLVALNSQAEAIQAQGQKDPNQEYRARQQQLQAELDRLDGRLKALTIDLISPGDMAEVLRGVLLRQRGMRLVHLENFPAEDLLLSTDKEEGDNNAGRIQLFRHPMRIVFSGTYLQALAYLQSLENLPHKLYWDDLEIVVNDHPQAEISLTVHTLSLRKGWIGA